MHVKTYTGNSTQEVLAQIKAELGPEAVILSSRSYRKNGARLHEVTAGVERIHAVQDMHTLQDLQASGLNYSQPPNAGINAVTRLAAEALKKAQEAEYGDAHSRRSQGQGLGGHIPTQQNPTGWSEWHKEWLQIKEHLFALMKPSIQLERLTPRQRVALEYLQREGVSDVVALELYRRLLMAPGASVLESLGELVPVLPWNLENWPQRIHCFAGPFGAGKTTTALRIALFLRTLQQDIRIAFINADCHRGNGRLILRHWAELSDFSYHEALDAKSLEKALISNAYMDKIFIDMPAVSSKENLQKVCDNLGLSQKNSGEIATHTVLSPAYDGAQITAFLQRYAPCGQGSLIWGKLDEAISYGSIVNACAACRVPVSALSYGAELRESLVSASESLLWRLIFKRQLPGTTSQTA